MTERLERISLNGQEFWVEVADVRPAGGAGSDKSPTSAGDSGKPGDAVDNKLVRRVAETDIERILVAVAAPVAAAVKAMGSVTDFTVELTLGLKGEIGFFLAKGEANASLKVSVKMKPPGP